MKRALLLCCLAWPSQVWAHGASKSFAEWTVDDDRAHLRINFAAHDVIAAITSLDADGDQSLSAAELVAGQVAFGARVLQDTKLRTAPPCHGDTPVVRGIGDPVDEIQVEIDYRCEGSVTLFHLEAAYLGELEPTHNSVATLSAGTQVAQHVFGPATPVFELKLTPPPPDQSSERAWTAGRAVGRTPAPILMGLALGLLGGPMGAVALLLWALAAVGGGALTLGAGGGVVLLLLPVAAAPLPRLHPRWARVSSLILASGGGLLLGRNSGNGMVGALFGFGTVGLGLIAGFLGLVAARMVSIPVRKSLAWVLLVVCLLFLGWALRA